MLYTECCIMMQVVLGDFFTVQLQMVSHKSFAVFLQL